MGLPTHPLDHVNCPLWNRDPDRLSRVDPQPLHRRRPGAYRELNVGVRQFDGDAVLVTFVQPPADGPREAVPVRCRRRSDGTQPEAGRPDTGGYGRTDGGITRCSDGDVAHTERDAVVVSALYPCPEHVLATGEPGDELAVRAVQ
jgi:hypothetical protein